MPYRTHGLYVYNGEPSKVRWSKISSFFKKLNGSRIPDTSPVGPAAKLYKKTLARKGKQKKKEKRNRQRVIGLIVRNAKRAAKKAAKKGKLSAEVYVRNEEFQRYVGKQTIDGWRSIAREAARILQYDHGYICTHLPYAAKGYGVVLCFSWDLPNAKSCLKSEEDYLASKKE